jgi:hypothetical protein
MEAYQTKAIKLYLNFFMKDKVLDFENRIIKAKSKAISYAQREIALKENDKDELFYWTNVKNALDKI